MGYVKIPEPTNRAVDFTSSGTWTCPAGVYSAEFLVVGAGGAGGGVGASGATRVASAGGGGGGAVKKITLPVVPATSYTITIGAKGTGAAALAGGNGGYTEVLNGATVLIRSFGGRGGLGLDAADNDSVPTLTTNIGGGGGYGAGTLTTNCGGGGGGASTGVGLGTSATLYASGFNSQQQVGLEGAFGKNSSLSSIIPPITTGGAGIDGYGAGGGGGAVHLTTASQVQNPVSSAPYGAGAGATRSTTGSTAGSNAIANTGSGGGGAATHTNTTSRAGGDGADGIVRITYFA
jgi:hypothetical protein